MKAKKAKKPASRPDLVVMTEADAVQILRALVRKARTGDVAAASVLLAGDTWDTLADFGEYLRAGGK